MPSRILREGIITSERINALSERAELFYRRLMSVADDYGRYFASPAILRANCYPLRLDQMSEKMVSECLAECLKAGLVTTYGAGKYLSVVDFKQQTRSKSKFPEPFEPNTPQKPDEKPLSKCETVAHGLLNLVGVGVGVGVGCVVGDVRENWSEMEKAKAEIGEMFKRTKYDAWSHVEERQLFEVMKRGAFKSELAELKGFKGKPKSFFPQSVERLLLDWTVALDRARNYVGEAEQKRPASIQEQEMSKLRKELENL